MRAWAVMLLFLGMIGPVRAQRPGSARETFGVSAHPAGDSIRVRILWKRNERDVVSLRLILMDFEGRNLKTWQARVKLLPNQDTAALFGGVNPTAFGLDSGKAVLGIEATLSCGCETSQGHLYFRPPESLILPEPGLAFKIEKSRGNWHARISAARLARLVTLRHKSGDWLPAEDSFDMLPGEEKIVPLTRMGKDTKPRPEDFILQSAYPNQK